jgi:hypothetical protein
MKLAIIVALSEDVWETAAVIAERAETPARQTAYILSRPLRYLVEIRYNTKLRLNEYRKKKNVEEVTY